MSTLAHEELSTCAYGPRLCRHTCPVALGEASETLNPSQKIALLQWWKQGHITLDDELAMVFYACNHCGGCTAACSHGQQPARMLFKARQQAVERGVVPAPVRRVLEISRKHGHPWGADSPERHELPYNPKAPIQFLPGAASGWRVEEIKAQVEALRRVLGREVSVLPPDVTSGQSAWATGDRGWSLSVAERLVNHIKQADQLVVAEPFDEWYLREHFPDTGLVLPVTVTLLLSELATATILNRSADWRGLQSTVLYHDPAPMGRQNRLTAQPRELLTQLGYSVIDFGRNRHHSSATGAGGIVRWTYAEGIRRNAAWLLQEVHETQQRLKMDNAPGVVTLGEASRSLLAESDPSLTVLDLNVLLARTIAQ